MVNFYVPNYTKEEFEELDNKVLLLSKEKYSQLNIKFKEKCCSIVTNFTFFMKNNAILMHFFILPC